MSIPPQNRHALMKMPFYSPISMSDVPSTVLQSQMNSSVRLSHSSKESSAEIRITNIYA